MVQDQTKKQQLLKQFNETLNFAESVKQKINTDPLRYDIQQKYMSQYNEQEQSIINAAAIVRDIHFDLWSP